MKIDLQKFISAQETTYESALQEIRSGKKKTHWMWFVFPQVAGLGSSDLAIKYAIDSLVDAVQYLRDETLGKRLSEITAVLAYELNNRSADQIFGFPDNLKFHASLTLFYTVVESNVIEYDKKFDCFKVALEKYFDGKLNEATMNILHKAF